MSLFQLKLLQGLVDQVTEGEEVVSQVAVDSRLCSQGSLFFALKGSKTDGHQFLKLARDNQAKAAVVSLDYQGDSFGLQLLRAKDSLRVLQQLAKKVIEMRKPFIIGITGSVGKTTTKEFVATFLKDSFSVSQSIKSYNGQIGLPLSILNADPLSQVLVLEYGISQCDEMRKLLNIASPHVVIITPIAQVHIEFFQSVENIAQEKAILLQSSQLKLAVIHEKSYALNPIQSYRNIKKISYGFKKADYTISMAKNVSVIFKNNSQEMTFSCEGVAFHHLENILPAIIVAQHFGLSQQDLQKSFSRLQTLNHRFEQKKIKGVTIIDDSYNSNPFALKVALQNLPQTSSSSKVIAVLGEMTELGHLSDLYHQEVGRFALKYVDHLICYGDKTKPLYHEFKKEKKAQFCLSKQEIIEVLKDLAKPGDIVLIKASNSHKLWELVDRFEKEA